MSSTPGTTPTYPLWVPMIAAVGSAVATGLTVAAILNSDHRKQLMAKDREVLTVLHRWTNLKTALDAASTAEKSPSPTPAASSTAGGSPKPKSGPLAGSSEDVSTDPIEVGDQVQVYSEPEVRNSSLWDVDNTVSCGKKGIVERIDPDGDVEIRLQSGGLITCDIKFLKSLEPTLEERHRELVKALIDDVDGAAKALLHRRSAPRGTATTANPSATASVGGEEGTGFIRPPLEKCRSTFTDFGEM